MNYNESDIEDWLAKHLHWYIHPHAALVGRQVTLPSGGRLDLLFGHHSGPDHYLTVVEVKKGRADVDAVLQTKRYMTELERANLNNVTVYGLLVAETVSDKAAAVLCHMDGVGFVEVAVNLCCTLWQYPQDSDSISSPDHKLAQFMRPDPHGAWDGPLAGDQLVGELIKDRLDAYFRKRSSRDAYNRRFALVPTTTTSGHNGNGLT